MNRFYINIMFGYNIMAAKLLNYNEDEIFKLISTLEYFISRFCDIDALKKYKEYEPQYYNNMVIIIEDISIPTEYNNSQISDMIFENQMMKTRVCNLLERNGIKYIRDLRNMTKKDILKMKKFGKASYDALVSAVRMTFN